eukprot:scaffold1582_cov318-Pavlova_lutheri.AAC.3
MMPWFDQAPRSNTCLCRSRSAEVTVPNRHHRRPRVDRTHACGPFPNKTSPASGKHGLKRTGACPINRMNPFNVDRRKELNRRYPGPIGETTGTNGSVLGVGASYRIQAQHAQQEKGFEHRRLVNK